MGDGEGAEAAELELACWLEGTMWLDRDWEGDWVGDGLGVWEGELIGVGEAYDHPIDVSEPAPPKGPGPPVSQSPPS